MYLLYFVLWIIFNANITLEICIFGIVISALVFAFTCKFMDYSIQKELFLWKKSFRLLKFIGILIIEIMKANMAVIRMILSEKEEIQPVIVSFENAMQSDLGKVLLANAITLTPGTITVSLEDKKLMVHCLDEGYAQGMDVSSIASSIHKIEA